MAPSAGTWPGNVRELETPPQRLALLAGDGATGSDRLRPRSESHADRSSAFGELAFSLEKSQWINRASPLGGPNGIGLPVCWESPATIYRKIKEYEL
jgi:transcriptional regulator of acetoin/glycerol metabolism